MKIVQICYQRYPSAIHVGGGDVRFWQDLRSLTALGHEVHVIVCDSTNECTRELEQLASSVTSLRSGDMRPGTPRWLASRVLNPSTLALVRPDLRGLRTSVDRLIDDIDPDLIWAEEAFSVVLSPDRVPIVHSHHDFMFKLRPIRRRFFGKWLRRPHALTLRALQKLEVDLCRRAAINMCASQSEANYLTELGIAAVYLPVAGETTRAPNFDDLSPGRLFLFGNPNTAMRAARQNLQTEIWPIVERKRLELEWHQLGKTPRPGADPSWRWIEQHFAVHGYVPDLSTVLRPGDASIMPYPFDTGGRAKFAVSAGYGLVNIAYEETFRSASEFTHDEDSLAATSPEHFVELLDEFCSNSARRRRLAEGSRAVYERCHTMGAQLPRYESILRAAM
jgi:glycosyltransferase involved in cell wall biosynthesis